MSELKKVTDALGTSVDLTEVVNVFVSRYEENLYSKLSELQSELKIKTQALQTMKDKYIKQFQAKYSKLEFESSLEELTISVDKVTVSIESGEIISKVQINLKISEGYGDGFKLQNSNYASSALSVRTYKRPVDQEYLDLEKEIQDLSSFIIQTNNSIRQIPRKERVIRAKISESKLIESGFNLEESEDLMKLIEIKS